MSPAHVRTNLPPVGTRYSAQGGSWVHVPITLEPKPITRPGDTTYYRNLLVYVQPTYGAGVQLLDDTISVWLSLGTDSAPDPDQVWFNPFLYCNPVNIPVPDTAQTTAITYHFWLDFRLDAALPPPTGGQLNLVVYSYDYGLDANPPLSGKVVV